MRATNTTTKSLRKRLATAQQEGHSFTTKQADPITTPPRPAPRGLETPPTAKRASTPGTTIRPRTGTVSMETLYEEHKLTVTDLPAIPPLALSGIKDSLDVFMKNHNDNRTRVRPTEEIIPESSERSSSRGLDDTLSMFVAKRVGAPAKTASTQNGLR